MQCGAAVLLLVMGVGADTDLEWNDNYGEAKRIAAQKKMPVVVLLEDPSNPATSFNEKELASDPQQVKLLQKYQLCRIDVTSNYGKSVAKSFKATRFPYTIMLDRSASFITLRRSDKMTPNQWASSLIANKDKLIHKPAPIRNSATGEPFQSFAFPSADLSYPSFQPGGS